MNRVISRAKALILLVIVLGGGTLYFLGEYFVGSGDWILSPGSPHVYNAGNIGCGLITDREGLLLLDLTSQRTYSASEAVRKATIHWLGDRQGNISAPAISYYSDKITGFDPINGVYAYGGTGGQVELTLSAKVQAAALEAMGDYKGTIGIYNYKTGELICAVSTPNYDPDNVPDILGDSTGAYEGAYVNRFTGSAYTPGSIFKIVTAAAALETIPDILEQTFTCNGIIEYGIDSVTCLSNHGELSFREAFAESCNCAFAQIAGQLGGKTLQEYAQSFGITESLRFDGITTVSGNVEAENAAAVLVAWSAVGQHKDLVNPARFMSFVGAIANDGVLVEPHLVSKITVGNKTTYNAETAASGRIMTSRTASILQEMMGYNVEYKYGAENFPGLTVCAKSGTAEVGGDKKPNAMFAGFVADEAYPLAFIVAIEDGGYGRQICVPILSQVLSACKELMDGQ